MDQNSLISVAGMAAAIILPLLNIPLILRIVQRKSSQDLSLSWAVGVWICIVLMVPSAFRSTDVIWRTFSCLNVLLFTGVVLVTFKYRNGPGANDK